MGETLSLSLLDPFIKRVAAHLAPEGATLDEARVRANQIVQQVFLTPWKRSDKQDQRVALIAGRIVTEWALAATRAKSTIPVISDQARSTTRAEHRPFPRAWELFAFILDHRTRERVWEPLQHELLADYIDARRYRTRWARRWIAFAFTMRTLWGVLDCFRVMVTSSTGRFLGRLIPPRLTEWWFGGP